MLEVTQDELAMLAHNEVSLSNTNLLFSVVSSAGFTGFGRIKGLVSRASFLIYLATVADPRQLGRHRHRRQGPERRASVAHAAADAGVGQEAAVLPRGAEPLPGCDRG